MKNGWIARVVCLLAVLGIMLPALGCRNTYTPERRRRRMISMREDGDRMVDDVDWVFGLVRPVYSFDETLLE